MPSDNSVAVIGAGAWGTALAGVAARAGRDVVLYARNADHAAQMKMAHANPRLPGVQLDNRIEITNRIAAAAGAKIFLIATPAQNLREAALTLAPHLKKATPVIAAAKGIERGTHKFMTEVIAEAVPEATPAILSGPSFAADVARQRTRHWRASWCRRSAHPPSGPITPRMSAASRSGALRKTCWRSRPELWRDENLAHPRWPP
jgi:glycerol-3-phosphate dehydrogenase (NAD(P)+)